MGESTTTMEKSKIQTLYEACSVVFSQQQELPSFQQIQCLKNLLGLIEAKDVGIDEFGTSCGSPSSDANENVGFICGQDVSEVTYIHIHECPDFSIGIFCFPEGETIPLHDHPGMMVFSKLLYGSVYVKAYDWASRTLGLAATVRDEILEAPCEARVLFPRSGGNIHSFTAISPCAILDVLTPPYSEELGRPSTYFSAFPVPSLPGYAVLEERDLPDNFFIAGAPYVGPPVDASHDFC